MGPGCVVLERSDSCLPSLPLGSLASSGAGVIDVDEYSAGSHGWGDSSLPSLPLDPLASSGVGVIDVDEYCAS